MGQRTIKPYGPEATHRKLPAFSRSPWIPPSKSVRARRPDTEGSTATGWGTDRKIGPDLGWGGIQWSLVEDVVEASRWILAVPIDPENDPGVQYDHRTWGRATDFLRNAQEVAAAEFVGTLPMPQINPSDEGSIDLFWESDEYQFLLNCPSDPGALLTYYGKTLHEETIAGTIRDNSKAPEIIAWLLKR